MSAPVRRPPPIPSGEPPSTGPKRRRGAVALLGRVAMVLVLLGAVGGAMWATNTWGGPPPDAGGTSAVRIPALEVAPAPVQLGSVAQPGADTPPAVAVQPSQQATAGRQPSAGQETLTVWANRIAGRVDVPARALYAYGLADLVMRKIDPGCHLSWVTLGGIGRVESDHGRFGGAVLGADGRESRPIIGIPLDGTGSNATISDTDGGALDGDPLRDHAVGPMQFIPSTWANWRSDGNGDKIADPENIDDAALTAARYLCADGRDMATGPGWSAAVLSYNNSVVYGQRVYGVAESYARASSA